jgi:hypothetical protein
MSAFNVAMTGKRHTVRETAGSYSQAEALSPFKEDAWKRLTPAQRLERSWKMRERIPDLAAVHDQKLFPKP